MITRDDVRAMVSEEIGVDPGSFADDDNLVELGMHSLKLMKVAGRWRKLGHQVNYSELVLAPTVEAWAALLGVAETQPIAALPAADDEPEFGLATMQHAYWVGRQSGQSLGGVAAHLYVEFDGADIDVDRLARAVRRVIERHDMLRVAFTDNGTQRILSEAPAQVWSVQDLSGLEPGAVTQALADTREAKSHQFMDVAAGQVVDFSVSVLPDGRHRVHVDVDMLAADAMSYRRILADLADLYVSDADALAPIDYTYRRYLADKARAADRSTIERDRTWWDDRIDTLPDVPALPTIPEAERTDVGRSVRVHHRFDAAQKQRLHDVAFGHGLTPAVVLGGLFCEVLAEWSSSQQLLLNVPLFNREQLHPDVDRVVGDFTNSVLLDVDLTDAHSALSRARRFQHILHTASSHSAYEGLEVLRDIGRHRGSPITPSVVFTSGLGLGELFSDTVTDVFGDPVWILSQGPQVDLDAQVVEIGGGILINWDVRRDALPAGVVETMFARYVDMIENALAPEYDWTATTPAVLPVEQSRRRNQANAGVTAELPARTLHDRFFDLAAIRPERRALRWGEDDSYSYGDLAADALRVAASLTATGVVPGDTVAVVVPKGHRQVVAVLGVLAAGGVYLPVGIDQPVERKAKILERGDVRIAIADDGVELPAPARRLDFSDALRATPAVARATVAPNALAYVLFTSGSTGEPKGVEVSHSAAAATIDAITGHVDLTDDDCLIGLSALEFDLSVFDIFATLGLGGTLACVDASMSRDAHAWSTMIRRFGVTVVNAAPGLITMLADTASADDIARLRVILTGGDRVDAAVARRLRTSVPGLRFIGLGGTTETAIHSTICEVTDESPNWTYVPYGVPMNGVACRVVNSRGEDCPDWVRGEIWIGGRGVAQGYRGDPDRTSDRFVTYEGQRWYRTGDMGRYLPDGTLDFLGRADHQVKIRGYRVELGEIEVAMKRLSGVETAVAAVVGIGTSARLVAAAHGTGLVAEELLEGLSVLLPDYMIPESVDVLDTVPVTGNGKVDRAAILAILRDSTDGTVRNSYVPPGDDVEAALAYLMEQILEVESLGVETDFFEAGGNSIMATIFVAKVRGMLLVPAVTISDVFDARTVRALAARLRTQDRSEQLEQVAGILVDIAGIATGSATELTTQS
ncbi:non-ribosomal peptide synthetase [Rhodococcoides kyotonense]|uniref:Phenyloxazoline synthase MbtB n=1 Tax=Rhodococcoides kyotonense TaxID=398843 RepID=A0A239N4B9_9NOCA|nr:non-ribosomal peptide synthetase [Rhodococcus kyotonensis]SNT49294.1 mycobactin phenyloxazoline synthetase [Rhodococcus kyotonensis]